ncbi:uncharacterized protein Dana_GF26892 [Drosophila ananassae]|uniref:trypsin n=1 Tax=Drosophila ananassae TaxID=7217 RepID=A0A0P8Y246_DROAN|nr:seminase [Drosophila ananassae]KPU80851.1 uncharacterized protein Dana_GF26892 [Drosophila ananassae]
MVYIFLLLMVIATFWPLPTGGRVYQNNIRLRTQKFRRSWNGPEQNTGQNYGGWLMRIVNVDGSSICGAAYYSPLLLITSANCIHPYRYSLEGTSVEPTAFLSNCENIFGLIDTVYTPEEFKYLGQYMDIAVIRLKRPIQGKLTEFIRLCSTPIKTGMKMTAYAWGFDSLNIVVQTSDARNGSVTVEDPKECNKKYRNLYKVSKTSFCVTHPKKPTDCRYDGGAPLTYGTELCGVVSHGPLCSDTSQPGIYTDINLVAKFIKDVEKKIASGKLVRSLLFQQKFQKYSLRKSSCEEL